MQGKKTALIGMFIALSVAGAAIKIPAVVGSVALDAAPALVSAVILGSVPGALIAGSGHLLSALLGGMPLGPLHLIVALEMGGLAWIFGRLYTSEKRILAATLFIIGNAIVAPLPFILFLGLGFYLAILPSLFIGSVLNLVIAVLILPRLLAITRQSSIKKDVKE
jgi:uncharacterized membrane protein